MDGKKAVQLRAQAEAARSQGDLESAQLLYEQASELLRSSSNHLLYAHTIRHLGDVLLGREHWDRAGECYVVALQIYRENTNCDSLDYANAIRSYAVLQSTLSRQSWHEARQIYAQLGVTDGVTECDNRLSKL